MKLLIGGSPSKLFHLREFAKELEGFGVESKLVLDVEYCDGFPSRKVSRWVWDSSRFNNLIRDFSPDLILVDRQRHFGLAASKTGIPLLVHLRGDYWKEMQMARETLYKSAPKRVALWKWGQIANKCFERADLILPICHHLENRVREHYPQKKTATMYQGINPDNWFATNGTSLKHPCVGLLQSAVIWEKTKEMLTLEEVLKKLPHVTFYWVGDGPYREYVLSRLQGYENFKWLGSLEYPDKVREFLSEIDVYLLLSGIDMSPLTLLEAQLMERPVIATNVGGIPELMKEEETGMLLDRGDHGALLDKINTLLSDESKRKSMGAAGRQFVKDRFNWKRVAGDFVGSLKEYSLI